MNRVQRNSNKSMLLLIFININEIYNNVDVVDGDGDDDNGGNTSNSTTNNAAQNRKITAAAIHISAKENVAQNKTIQEDKHFSSANKFMENGKFSESIVE